MTALEIALLLMASALGGALNSVAGGGSFLTFPALILAGVPPLIANATSAFALWPGSVFAVVAYRRELEETRLELSFFSGVSVLGGLLGALALLGTPNAMFEHVVPALLLVATLLVTFGPRLATWAKAPAPRASAPGARRWWVLGLQLCISSYGGYFGGGMGVLMLATLSLFGMTHMHRMNAVKCFLAVVINVVAVGAFAMAGKIAWSLGLGMAVFASAGGYFGGSVARKADARRVRRVVQIAAWCITVYFFLRVYAA